MQLTTTISERLIKKELQHISYDSMMSFLKNHDMVDWMFFAQTYDQTLFTEKTKRLDPSVDYIVSFGVGGSYHGLETVAAFFQEDSRWIFLGGSFDSAEIEEVKFKIKNKKIGINLISKSGDTLEIRLLIDIFIKEIACASYINVITSSFAFYQEIEKTYPNNLCTHFVIQEKTGGRFSLVGEMGLLGLYLCGQDANELIVTLNEELQFWKMQFSNSSLTKRGVSRFLLQKHLGISIEALSTNRKEIFTFFNWVAQLMAESDGKDRKGLYLTKLFYPQDAHSMSQILKDGSRIIAETFYSMVDNHTDILVESTPFSSVKIRSLNRINDQFSEAILEEREESSIYVTHFLLESRTVQEFTKLIITEMGAICLESYLLKLNPFDQPGVEGYKQKVKKRLL